LIQNGIVIGVLDVDSEELANFDATDSQHLEELCSWLVTIL
jgi:putative methionine-R-sulfoxide reductase with GAF domain